LPSNYIRIYVHLVWKTWDKLPLLQGEAKSLAYKIIIAKGHKYNCDVIGIGGVEDHVHVLIRLHPTACVSKVVQEMKGGSSSEINECSPDKFFKWQGAYGASSVDEARVPQIIEYIENQQDHHNRNYLREELETVDTA
jgi:REP element-mobilizing transposase RayT